MSDNKMREALQQALAALEYHTEQTRPIHSTNEAIATLRAALAQQASEEDDLKVTKQIDNLFTDRDNLKLRTVELENGLREIAEWTERYTAPNHPISTIARRLLTSPLEHVK